jgi:hypothetical protein
MRGVAARRSQERSPARAGSFGQSQGPAPQRIIAEWSDGFQTHVSGALDGPLVILFEQDGANEAGDGRFVGEEKPASTKVSKSLCEVGASAVQPKHIAAESNWGEFETGPAQLAFFQVSLLNGDCDSGTFSPSALAKSYERR